MNKVKIQLDESQEKIKTYQDECFSFSGKIKSLEDKINSNKYILQSNRNQLKEKDNELKKLRNQVTSMDSFKEEKSKHDKILDGLQQTIQALKDDNE